MTLQQAAFGELMAPGVRFAAKAARQLSEQHADKGDEWGAAVLDAFAHALDDTVTIHWKIPE